MSQLRLAFRSLMKTPVVTTVAVLSLALGIGANVAIFSIFNQTLLRPLAVHEPDEPGESGVARTPPGLGLVRSERQLRQRVQLPDVPRSRAGADVVHRHRRAQRVRREHRVRRIVGRRRQRVRVGELFPRPWSAPANRPAARTWRRAGAGRGRRCRVERRLLAAPVRREPRRARQADSHQRPGDDDRRCRTARLPGNDDWQPSPDVRADLDERNDRAAMERPGEPADILGSICLRGSNPAYRASRRRRR